jgi:iron complex outermembrane recepter protein
VGELRRYARHARSLRSGSPALPAAAHAQAAAAVEDDTIIVTGIRGSLSRAIDTKRNADVIVDSISSEDLGKFPDSNVAESLQRITGVSIDRSGGEGQFVTVRGFGPSFNNVLVNGRTIATENQGRAFSFDLLAAELISGADVYKSSNAVLQDGGIGATVNVKTARPFDINGTRVVLSGRANYEELSDKFAGTAFGLFSTTLADDTIGILLSGSYQRRKAQINTVATNGYFRADLPLAGLTGVNFPQNYDQIVDTQDRERIGITGTLQWRPSDTLLLTLDGLYNKFTVDSTADSIGHFFSQKLVTAVTIDSNRTVTRFSQNGEGHTDYISRTFNRPTELQAYGANLAWNPTELITVSSDTSWSQAKSNNGGNEIFAVIGFENAVTFDNTGTGLPGITADASFTDPAAGRAHFATREGFDVSEEVFEQRLDATFRTDGGTVKAVRLGGYFQDRVKSNSLLRSQNDVGCAYCGYAVPTPAGLLQPFNPGSFFEGQGANLPRAWLKFNAEDYFTFLESTAAANAQDVAFNTQNPDEPRPVGSLAAFLAANNGYDPILYPVSFRIKERVIGGYGQVDFGSTIGGLPWSGSLGVRYVHTRVISNGSQQELLELREISGDTTAFTAVFAPTAVPVTRRSTYNDFLPSLNVKVDFSDDIVGRFAASRTITRPDLTLLAPRVSFDNLRPGNLQASGGNPELEPYRSTNADLSFEYYYQPGGYFTVGAFYKRVENFIVSQLGDETFRVATNPDFPTGNAAFRVLRPRNLEDADVYGVEVGFQHSFTYLPGLLSGFGVTANATFVSSSAALTTGAVLPLEGLGDSQNLVLFYDKGAFEARVAYNRRDEFIQTAANGTGGDPIFVEAQGQVDVSARYDITRNVSVFFEGINITNETVNRRGAFDNQFLSIVESGARYALGARLTF